MELAGLQKFSTIDYPKKICCVLFTKGCNMDCAFCHNKGTALNPSHKNIETSKVIDFLHKRKGLLEAVCISGGEPTLQKDLKSFVTNIKALGYKIKLDTNGMNPDVLEDLLKNDLIDFVAMDIKAPLCKYDIISGVNVDKNKIINSVDIIINSGVDYEFRTTFTPELDSKDIMLLAQEIKDAKKYVLQQFRQTDYCKLTPHSKQYVLDTLESIKIIISGTCEVRGL